MGIRRILKLRTLLKVFSLVIIFAGFFTLGIFWGDGRIPNGIEDLLNPSNANNLPASINYSALQQEYDLIKQNYDGKLTAQQLQQGAEAGLANATGDPYTEYFSPSEAKNFNNQLNNTFTGIGAVLGVSNGNIVIISPVSGFPADKAGIQPGDVISSINGTSTSGMNIDTAVNDIRGAAGTKVTLGIIRNGQHLSFTITRATITVPSVSTKIINGNIGYMQIITFANDTSSLAQNAANMFKSKGVKAIILDLRDNPGGLVDAAINVSSLWLQSGKSIMIQKHDNQVVNTYTSTGNDILNGIPTVVLINGGSASASEITSASLHDNGAAYLIGQKSFGKGTEQQLVPLFDGSELKVTIAHWYTPKNVSIEYKGITPDQTINLGPNQANTSSDSQLNAAIQYLDSQISK